ncbi:hypothetical protein [Paenibacillus nasutitermitis]|uniref:Uncharacterized protein n=1 Tax=Paenibacillus nasutitermitis TaxID=1652958 RepID=A0A916YX41_9BACL|nr:hypothetical protein [Paenibacillus nasutitermitis]GGD65447.1 hypothetical protein GCM10010911_24060 [Paenibacillus nasutitermitis]
MAFDFDDLEKWMDKQQLPKGFDLFRQPDWIEDYVRKMMTKAMPAASSVIRQSKAEITESKSYVTVSYPLGENVEISKVRLVAREDHIKLSGLEGERKEVIKLPRLVLPRSCQAVYDGNLLKVKLRRRPRSKRSFEPAIHWD